jgi:predicted PurR-regulated permease PerM
MQKGARTVRLEVTWKTIFKLLLGVLLAFAAVKLRPIIQMLTVAILLAVPLSRLVRVCCDKGWPRWAGVLVASLALVVAVFGLAALVVPLVIKEASQFGKNVPKLQQFVVSHLPPGQIKTAVQQQAEHWVNGANLEALAQKALGAVRSIFEGVLGVVLVIAFAIYLMIDGPRALAWLIAFFPRRERARVAKGLDKITGRMVAYVVGQGIVSGLFAAYVFTVLSIVGAPMALLLALVAGVMDVVPVIGITLSLILGVLVSLTVSASAALIVLGCYLAYHVLENYFIIPKVYGRKLQISTLAVLVTMIAGGLLAGVIGAIAALPLVAAYPALESLWLRPELEPETVEDHQKQLRAA